MKTLYDVFHMNNDGAFVMRASVDVIADYYRLPRDAMRRIVNCDDDSVTTLHGTRQLTEFEIVVTRVNEHNMPRSFHRIAYADACDDDE